MIGEVIYALLIGYVITADLYLIFHSKGYIKSKKLISVILWVEFIPLILALGHCIFWYDSNWWFMILVCVIIMIICNIVNILRLNSRK